jgi:hypothetical protein
MLPVDCPAIQCTQRSNWILEECGMRMRPYQVDVNEEGPCGSPDVAPTYTPKLDPDIR